MSYLVVCVFSLVVGAIGGFLIERNNTEKVREALDAAQAFIDSHKKG